MLNSAIWRKFVCIMEKVRLLKTVSVVVMAMLCGVQAKAQYRVNGVVKDSLGDPLAKAYVMEMDEDHRVLNQVQTDLNGFFVMSVRDTLNGYLRIVANGYHPLRERINRNGQRYDLKLALKPASRLQTLKKHMDDKERFVRSRKLFCGRNSDHSEPWLLQLSKLSDTIYVLRLPVKATNESSVYAEGRTLFFADPAEKHILMLSCSEDAYPIPGNPNEEDTWDEISSPRIGGFLQRGLYEGNIIEDGLLFFYPQFVLTRHELNLLVSQADRVLNLSVDTEAGDNYWLMYPMANFASELKKMVAKLDKK